MTLVDRLADRLAEKTSRRSFLNRLTMWSAAVVAAPSVFMFRPTTAYAAICSCAGQSCDCGSKCCGGYTEFCCTIYGENACPPGGIIGGWWKVDSSSFCGGKSRYYMDCHEPCNGCSCGSSGVCNGSCNGTDCECANHDCSNRKAGCIHFRYGNCNNQISCVGPIVCRVVTCTAPWQVDSGCNTAVRVDEGTRHHDSPCLHLGNDPVGWVDSIGAVPGFISVAGWALDLDSDDPAWVHTYIDGEFAGATRMSIHRPDVQRVFGTESDVHGFEETFAARPGVRRICVYAINVGGGRNQQIACFNINVPDRSPVGHLELVEDGGEGVRVQGWAFDRTEGSPPLTIRVTISTGVVAYLTADRHRNDVMRHFDLADNRVGFDGMVPAADGTATYCVEALDYGGDGYNVDLGCRRVDLDRSPNGWLDGVDVVEGGVRLTGWAVDPDSPDPVGIHVYADSTFIGGGRADTYRPDVGRALGLGDYHGYEVLLPLPQGSRTLKVYAINIGPGSNSLIGMRDL